MEQVSVIAPFRNAAPTVFELPYQEMWLVSPQRAVICPIPRRFPTGKLPRRKGGEFEADLLSRHAR